LRAAQNLHLELRLIDLLDSNCFHFFLTFLPIALPILMSRAKIGCL
jgi:hypothetical protein